MDKSAKSGIYAMIVFLITSCILLFSQGCGKVSLSPSPTPPPLSTPTASPSPSSVPSQEATPDASTPPAPESPKPLVRTDYENYMPNESGEIPIIMFHQFVTAFEPGMDKAYVTTFDEFEKLLPILYDQGFRLISMKDFIDCNIDVPAGAMPMVFTFDDGTPGQFNLLEKNGQFEVNPESAAGIMMKFSEEHPDFGLKGIFYLNMDIGDNTFKGAGSLKERFTYLIDKGFELGSHTWGHVNFKEINNKEGMEESLGRNQKEALSILPDMRFYSLALPYGSIPGTDELRAFLKEGIYQGIQYENQSIMAVGANPSQPSVAVKYNSGYVPRIRMQGQEAVDQDLTWWLPKMTASRMYVSDGDPDTIVVPADYADRIIQEKLNGKELITY